MIVKDTSTPPTVKFRIPYSLRGTSEWQNATVLVRAGKATGRNKFIMNILDDGDTFGKCIDWQHVDGGKDIHKDVLICSQDDIMTAKTN